MACRFFISRQVMDLSYDSVRIISFGGNCRMCAADTCRIGIQTASSSLLPGGCMARFLDVARQSSRALTSLRRIGN
jgi:hypothetical protein